MRPDSLKGQALGIGIGLTLLQLLIALALSPTRNAMESYSKLCAWDCGWYSAIARDGYRSTVPPVPQNAEVSNVGFFPGFPYLGRVAHLASGVKSETCLVVIAQLFGVLFWSALWMFLRRWRISPTGSAVVILAVLAHPAAIFLVAGYSESLFVSALLLFLLTAQKSKSAWTISTALPGMTMSATRIVGLPVAFFPLIRNLTQAVVERRKVSVKKTSSSAMASVIASMGTIAFLLYCQVRFGRYDLYMETQRIGWGITPDYGAIFKWKEFSYTYPIDRVATIVSGCAFVLLGIVEGSLLLLRRNRGIAQRLPICAVASLIFFITLSGLKSLGFRSMIRYTLPWHILLLLCFAHVLSRNCRLSRRAVAIGVMLSALGAFALFRWVGIPHIVDFLNGRWFA